MIFGDGRIRGGKCEQKPLDPNSMYKISDCGKEHTFLNQFLSFWLITIASSRKQTQMETKELAEVIDIVAVIF